MRFAIASLFVACSSLLACGHESLHAEPITNEPTAAPGTQAPYAAATSEASASKSGTTSAASPCSGSEHSQFDFWIGDWDVATEDGTPAGNNHIDKILNGCALRETWTSAKPPYTGTSLNIFDASRQLWHQTWVDNGGLLLQLEGGLDDGRMVMRGTVIGKDKKAALHEISWKPLPDGRVLQHWRASEDDGKTWTDLFVGYYSKIAM